MANILGYDNNGHKSPTIHLHYSNKSISKFLYFQVNIHGVHTCNILQAFMHLMETVNIEERSDTLHWKNGHIILENVPWDHGRSTICTILLFHASKASRSQKGEITQTWG